MHTNDEDFAGGNAVAEACLYDVEADMSALGSGGNGAELLRTVFDGRSAYQKRAKRLRSAGLIPVFIILRLRKHLFDTDLPGFRI